MADGQHSSMPEAVTKNIAVVGSGYWGQNIIRNFAAIGSLHTICDRDEKVLDHLSTLYPGINQETEFTRLLENPEIQGVVICTPAALHYRMTEEALLAGKDVFVEKPLALNVEEGEALVKLAREKDRILMVGHLLEYHPAIIKLKELVESGELGKIKYVYSSRLNLGKFRTEENILWSFAPHDISVILTLLEEMPHEVSAHGGEYLDQDISDITVTTMNFSGGTKAHIFVSWLHPYKEQKLIVIGGKKMAVFDDVTQDDKLVLYDHRIEWHGRVPVPEKKNAVPVDFVMEEPLKLECQHFINCMVSRQRAKTDGDKGLDVLRVLDACQKSLQGKGTIIPLNGREYYVHPTSLVEKPASIGNGTKIWHYCHLMPEVTVGKDCTIGQNVFIGRGVSIGNGVKIENNVSVFEGVTMEDDVFCGPSCTFTNVRSPRSSISQGGKYTQTRVKRGATIGANATIVCGNSIGSYAFIGAGAVVTKNVPDHALVYGNPAQIKGWVCECGTKLDFNGNGEAKCHYCSQQYMMQEIEGKSRIERITYANPYH